MLRLLLEADADIEAKTITGQTPLHAAAGQAANPMIIATPAEAGADINAETKTRWTPLHLAAWWNKNPDVTVALKISPLKKSI